MFRRTLAVLLLFTTFACSLVRAEETPQTIRDFGVVGDGQADDTAAIQKAVDSGLGDLHFPRGVYRLTKTVEIDLAKVGPTSLVANGAARIEMHGRGAAFRFSGSHLKGSAAPETFAQSTWDNERMPVVRGLEIIGRHAESIGIEAIGTMQLTISETNIRRCLHGVRLYERNRNVIVSHCHFYENAGIGLFLDDVSLHQINVVGSHISYNLQGGIVVKAGDVRNLHISGCDIEANMGKETESTANVLIDSTNGSIGEVAITGCTIQHTYDAPDSANIRIFGPSVGRTFTDERRDGNITIAANVLSDAQINIDLRSTRPIAISGNTIWKGFQHNLKAVDCQSITITGNAMDRNPRYGYGKGSEFSNAVLLKGCSDGVFSGNILTSILSDTASLTLEDCERIIVANCVITDSEVAGILAKNLTDSRIHGCIIRNRDPEHEFIPVKVEGGEGNRFE